MFIGVNNVIFVHEVVGGPIALCNKTKQDNLLRYTWHLEQKAPKTREVPSD